MAGCLIIKSLFKVHFFFYLVTFISLFTGHIRDYFFIISILIIHECGHLLGAFLFGWKLKKVILLPFGGLIVFDNLINISLFEQFIVTILGPLFQVVYFFLIDYYFNLSYMVIYYNFFLLIFNLLPIFPLDGSKLLNVFLNKFLPFKFSHLVLIVISFVLIFLGFFLFFNFIWYLILSFLLIKTYLEYKNHRFIFNKFLYERYCYDFHFKRVKYIKNANFMCMGVRHILFHEKNYITERNYLIKRFDKHTVL